MCLYKLKPLSKHIVNRKYGYKVFRTDKENLCFPYQKGNIKKHKWNIDSKTYFLYTTDYPEGYLTGYHLFTNKKHAKYYCFNTGDVVKKVEYDNVVATGEQTGFNVIVARKFRIIGD